MNKKSTFILTSLKRNDIIIVTSLKRGDIMAKIMTVRPPESMHQKLKEQAKRWGIPLNALVLQILREWIERKDDLFKDTQ